MYSIREQLLMTEVWCRYWLDFDPSSRYPVAVVLCDVLRATNRQKVQRVILATFRVRTCRAKIPFYLTKELNVHAKNKICLDKLIDQ